MFEQKSWAEAQEIIENNPNDQLLFLNFTTTWCGDCKMMKPIVDVVAKNFENNSKIRFINVDAEQAQLFRNPDSKWKVLRVPTMILLEGDEIVERGYEYIPTQILQTWIEKRLN
ncbi:thioredoxin family protein [Mycoplasma nasistruthionis]|uniref:Thioredoxin family protein n=1 Tax=Mycoplasma nasistruthionis TaxID=353852 RepID=A0A5B7XVJ0_9MOLU|nr:thioredoxin family protein [Mycoplasma nasistruthionis]QCZ36836.1 thioredoxin family protein [Mycoplasma nasistruthionis]